MVLRVLNHHTASRNLGVWSTPLCAGVDASHLVQALAVEAAAVAPGGPGGVLLTLVLTEACALVGWWGAHNGAWGVGHGEGSWRGFGGRYLAIGARSGSHVWGWRGLAAGHLATLVFRVCHQRAARLKLIGWAPIIAGVEVLHGVLTAAHLLAAVIPGLTLPVWDAIVHTE